MAQPLAVVQLDQIFTIKEEEEAAASRSILSGNSVTGKNKIKKRIHPSAGFTRVPHFPKQIPHHHQRTFLGKAKKSAFFLYSHQLSLFPLKRIFNTFIRNLSSGNFGTENLIVYYNFEKKQKRKKSVESKRLFFITQYRPNCIIVT